MKPELTIITCPKAFTGEFKRIQENALRSWDALGIPILMVKSETDTLRWALEFNAGLIQQFKRNQFGTPLLDDIFEVGQELSDTDLIAFVNTDILLWDDFLMAVSVCAETLPRFLMCGQRSNVQVKTKLRFDGNESSLAVARQLRAQSKHEGVGSSDYFVFRKGTLGAIPPFALGRWRWDNWLMDRPRQLGFPLVDATEVVFAAHQNHAPMPRAEGDAELHYNDWLVSQNGGRLGRLTDADYTLSADFQLTERVKA